MPVSVAEKTKCSLCQNETVKCFVQEGMTIKPVGGRFFSFGSGVSVHVCKSCGHIELYAVKLESLQ